VHGPFLLFSNIFARQGHVSLYFRGRSVMGTRDGAWTGVRCHGSSFLFWVKLAIGIVRAIGIVWIA
jgi:hypothetical protein